MKRLCEIEGCNKPHFGRGWCNMHWSRWRKHGDPSVTMTPNLVVGTAKGRFYSKVALPNENGCMLWLGARTPNGYGQLTVGGKRVSAHRMAYELMVGPIPEGLEIDHVKARGCKSRSCCAIEHLDLVTKAENIRRGDAGVNNAVKSHCPSGHPYSESNTYVLPSRPNARYCRACKKEREQRLRDSAKSKPEVWS